MLFKHTTLFSQRLLPFIESMYHSLCIMSYISSTVNTARDVFRGEYLCCSSDTYHVQAQSYSWVCLRGDGMYSTVLLPELWCQSLKYHHSVYRSGTHRRTCASPGTAGWREGRQRGAPTHYISHSQSKVVALCQRVSENYPDEFISIIMIYKLASYFNK